MAEVNTGLNTRPKVVVLDYGSGNIHSALRMLQRVGASVELTRDRDAVLNADGLFVPGVGNFHACMAGLRAADGVDLIRERVAAQRPLLGVCVGMQVLFSTSSEPSAEAQAGVAIFDARVERLSAPVVPHMGWSTVSTGPGSQLFNGVESERFYFVHSYAVPATADVPGVVTQAHHGTDFLAAIEDGCVMATQFHPEKSGDAGAQLLTNWLSVLR